MSTETQSNLAEQLAQLLAGQQQPIAFQHQAMQPSGWSRPVAATLSAPVGVSVPISLDTPTGKLRVYLHFDGSAASSPQALNALIDGLAAQGVPLDCWRARTDWRSGRSGWRG